MNFSLCPILMFSANDDGIVRKAPIERGVARANRRLLFAEKTEEIIETVEMSKILENSPANSTVVRSQGKISTETKKVTTVKRKFMRSQKLEFKRKCPEAGASFEKMINGNATNGQNTTFKCDSRMVDELPCYETEVTEMNIPFQDDTISAKSSKIDTTSVGSPINRKTPQKKENINTTPHSNILMTTETGGHVGWSSADMVSGKNWYFMSKVAEDFFRQC